MTAVIPRTADDVQDFTSWVRPCVPAMARLAGRLVPSADRDDLIQEALERAWLKWRTFDPSRGSAEAWLLAVLKDRARRRRTRARPDTVALDQVTLVVTDQYGDLALERAVAALPSRQRLAVNLHYFVGLGITECAEVMDCAPGTVKATLHQARQRLNAQLTEEPSDD